MKLFALILAVVTATAIGCGGHAVATLNVKPDTALGKQIQEAAGGTAEPAAEEAAAAPATADAWGNLTGKFVIEGPPPEPKPLAITKDEQVCGKHGLHDESVEIGKGGDGLKNVVIFLADKKAPIHPDYEATATATVRFDNDHCRFEPHIMPLRTTQILEIHNSDPVAHNSNLTPLGDAPFNQLISENKATAYQFHKQQNTPVMVTCSIHPWMRGYVFPRDNPYVAVTGNDGSFEIKNLPAGKHEFQVWQEAVGGLSAKPEWKKGKFKLEIQEGDNDLGTIPVAVTLLKK